jgi:hypothetical protein
MPETALAGAVGAENHCEWRKTDLAGVFPSLEILDAERGEHGGDDGQDLAG